MRTYIFLGSTLPLEVAKSELEAIHLPPVAEGDVYRLSLKKPHAIGIIDGYFEHVPSVRHKEILWAMSQGIHVYGSASMGALRAAELAAFGMEGAGKIFEAFENGTIEDDDEVCVTHGPRELGYPNFSEAMVNIRATLDAAVSDSVITSKTAAELKQISKALFYPERRYPLILQRGLKQGLNTSELQAFERWLPAGRINQKAEDALAMLRLMRARSGVPPKQVNYKFEHTVYWDKTIQSAGSVKLDGEGPAAVTTTDAILDELRLNGLAYSRALLEARLRHLGLREAQRRGYVCDVTMTEKMADRFRHTNKLRDTSAVDRWLDENDLSQEGFDELIRDEAQLRLLFCLIERETLEQLPAHLRATGAYARLRARAENKERVLSACGLQNPAFERVDVTPQALLQWYFKRLQLPPTTNVERYAKLAGFANSSEMLRTVLREFCYVSSQDRTS